MMNRTRKTTTALALCAVATLLLAGGSAWAQGIAHPVYVSVTNQDSVTPPDGDVLFEAWLLSAPENVGDQDSFDWGYSGGLLSVNCGNVFPSWDAGDVLHIEAEQPSTGYDAIAEYTLTYDNFQYFSGAAGMTLTPEPATMGLLALGGLALLRRRRRT